MVAEVIANRSSVLLACLSINDHCKEQNRVTLLEIDLTTSENITIDAVRALIASKDESEHRQLRVSDAGVACLSADF